MLRDVKVTMAVFWQRACVRDSTCEQHASGEHLRQYAASSPHVYGLGVVVGGQEQTGGTVPLSYQTLGQIALEKQVMGGGGAREGRGS